MPRPKPAPRDVRDKQLNLLISENERKRLLAISHHYNFNVAQAVRFLINQENERIERGSR